MGFGLGNNFLKGKHLALVKFGFGFGNIWLDLAWKIGKMDRFWLGKYFLKGKYCQVLA